MAQVAVRIYLGPALMVQEVEKKIKIEPEKLGEKKMNPAYEFEFTVGETYENEKGLFSVVSIAKEDMVIRWKNGEETQTSIEFQGRIQKRRQWEKTLQQEKTAAATKPAPKKAKASKSSKHAQAAEQDNRSI